MEKRCPNCGNILNEQAKFCPLCGAKQDEQAEAAGNHCPFCGEALEPGARFCGNCGRDLLASGKENSHVNATAADYVKSSFDKVAGTLNEKIGESGPVEVHLSDLVSEVFKKHTQEETEELFIAGTKKTTPKESEITAQWPKPWLYSRVFVFLAVTSLILYFILLEFQNINAIPGFIFMGAMTVPFALLVFFWEVNAPRNISIFSVVSMFFVGGVLSLVCTLILYKITGAGNLSYIGALLVGLVEEAGKIVVVAYYMKKTDSKYILNGLLLGACVGAGFAVFESAGYAFRNLLETSSTDVMLNVTLLRGVLSLGGHVVWTAIAGAALAATKGERPFNYSMLTSGRFLFFFAISVVLHGIWDCPLQFLGAYGKYIALIVVAWVVTLPLISSGLKQITRLAKQRENGIR